MDLNLVKTSRSLVIACFPSNIVVGSIFDLLNTGIKGTLFAVGDIVILEPIIGVRSEIETRLCLDKNTKNASVAIPVEVGRGSSIFA
jgi:hypothetical protein